MIEAIRSGVIIGCNATVFSDDASGARLDDGRADIGADGDAVCHSRARGCDSETRGHDSAALSPEVGEVGKVGKVGTGPDPSLPRIDE